MAKMTLMNIDASVMATVNRINEIIFVEDDIRKTLNREQDAIKKKIKDAWEAVAKSEPDRENPTPEIDSLQSQVDQIQAKKDAIGRYLRLSLFGQKGNKKREAIEGLYVSILTVDGTPLYETYEEAILKKSFKAYDEAIRTLVETWNTSENISAQTMGKFCNWVARVSTGVQRAKGHSNIQKGIQVKKKTEKAFYEDLFGILVDAMDTGKLHNPDLVIPKGETHVGHVEFENETLKVQALFAEEKKDDEEA